MAYNLFADGLCGPFDINQQRLVSCLVKELEETTTGFRNFHAKSALCRKLLSSEKLTQSISSLFGEDLLVWRTNSFKKKAGDGEISWHHDRHFENNEESIDFTNLDNHFSILIALTDMDESNGLMEFIPGSHSLESWPERDKRPFHHRELKEHFQDIPSTLVERKVSVPLKAGQFMLFHSGLLHRSLPASECTGNRYSLVARLCRKGTVIPNDLAEFNDIFSYPFSID